VNTVIIAVNKLDAVQEQEYNQQRYKTIVDEVKSFLISIGFRDDHIYAIPISGLTGENLMTRSANTQLNEWYHGKTLIELIDSLPSTSSSSTSIEESMIVKPTRVTVTDAYKSSAASQGFVVAGKVVSGSVASNDTLLVLPMNQSIAVRSVEVRAERVPVAVAGDHVEISIKETSSSFDTALLTAGQYLSSPTYPIPIVTSFEVQIITLNYKIPIIPGTSVVLYTGTNSEPAVISKLISILSASTGAVERHNPRQIPRQSSGTVEISVKRGICIELFSDYKDLGRVALRRGHDTIAVGVVTKINR
jgi:elongation factor 1 alpha-like protein